MDKLLKRAQLALQEREKMLAETYEQIEQNLILLGATAVEDRFSLMLIMFYLHNSK